VRTEPWSKFLNQLGEWIDWLRSSRGALAVMAVAPVVATLLVAIAEHPTEPRFASPCPLYPNATVALTSALHEACPLRYAERVQAVVRAEGAERIRGAAEVDAWLARGRPVTFLIEPLRGPARVVELAPLRIRPGEAAVRLAAASALALTLVVTVLLTAVPAGVPASLPFALIHAVAGVAIISTVAGATTTAFEVGDALARGALAGAILHLGLVFPQRARLVEPFREAVAAPYLFAFVVSAVEIQAAYGGSASAAVLAQRVSMTLAGIGLVPIAVGCYLTARESPSHLARGQARLFLSGVAMLGIPIALVFALGSPNVRLAAATLFAALLPFPIAYAIARYEVPDLAASFRRVFARAAYLALLSSAFFLVVFALRDRLGLPEVLRHPTVLFASVYCFVAPLDPLRARLERAVHAFLVSKQIDWDALGREYAQRIAAQRTPDGIGRAVGAALRAGLGETAAAILVAEAGGFRLAEAIGTRGFVDPALASSLLELSDEPVIDLNRLADMSAPVRAAHDAGVCAFARAECEGRLVACLVLVHERRTRMLGSSETQWVAMIADLMAAAWVASQQETAIRHAERAAARSRIESELAHDIGKPLGALEAGASGLAEELDPADSLVPALRKLARLAAHARSLSAAALARSGRGRTQLEDLVRAALLEVRALHGEDSVRVGALPEIGELPAGSDQLVRVLSNLLDNAVRASGPGKPVEIGASVEAGWLALEVSDAGHGMTSEQLRRAFVPFASFRKGGTGLGLAISRQIVASLGGRLTLAPRRDGPGLIAVARLPLHAEAA
jgi:signal transduction histidine kinase